MLTSDKGAEDGWPAGEWPAWLAAANDFGSVDPFDKSDVRGCDLTCLKDDDFSAAAAAFAMMDVFSAIRFGVDVVTNLGPPTTAGVTAPIDDAELASEF